MSEITDPAAQFVLGGAGRPDSADAELFPRSDEPQPSRTVRIPDLAHTFLFFALAILIVFVGELATMAIGSKLPLFRHEDFAALAGDPRLMIPAQAIQYAILLASATLIFGAIWRRPFWKAIHWNASLAAKRRITLAALGLALGLGSSVASNYLPMPKEAPILNDLMHSTTGAWLMFLFGTTGAPLVEELAFRGFLLPALLNFRRPRRASMLDSAMLEPAMLASALDPGTTDQRAQENSGDPLATPRTVLCILLTSAPFALLHSLQVSSAWAPILLIGIVSVALCLVRLKTNSLAASTLVHATYNFTLFAGMLIASDGFRHLEKLNN
jgi:hypothetical protein